MTALGKTLVFFNLLFSLVTGGLIIMVFLMRTNWKDGMDKAIQETKAAQAALKSSQATATQQQLDHKNALKKLDDEIVELKKQVGEKNVEIANQKSRVESYEKDARTQLAVSQAATVAIEKLQTERNQQAEQLTALNNSLVKVNKDLADTTQRETFAKLRGDQLDRDLSSRNEEFGLLKRKYEELRARPGLADNNRGATPNPPREASVDTKGKVTGTDGNIAVVSIGGDNGIETGHVLQVYRTSPRAEYLGRLVVTKAEAHQSVGNFEPAGRGKTVVKGDSVATRIQQ